MMNMIPIFRRSPIIMPSSTVVGEMWHTPHLLLDLDLDQSYDINTAYHGRSTPSKSRTCSILLLQRSCFIPKRG